MAELIYQIRGDNSGLLSATDGAIAGIKNLTSAVDAANLSLGFKNGVAALDTLAQKLLVVQGNSSLFGDSVKLQTQEVGAYQTALNSLLANGFDPMDGDVQRLKTRIDDLTASLQAASAVPPPRNFVNDSSGLPSAENLPTNSTGSTEAQSESFAKLNQQLQQGVITLEEYNAALLSANSTANTLTQGTQNLSEATQQADGYIEGLQQALKELNQLRLTAPEEDLALLNEEIQQTEVSLQQATNIGKVGFDEFGNSIRGVSLQNVNGQLIALSNNLFGARQIARDLDRSFTSSSIAGYAKNFSLLATDFLFYAQNAAFATGATTATTGAIATEGVVATGTAFSVEALGAAFASLLTPLNLIVLGIAVAAGGFEAYEKSQNNVNKASNDHIKALQAQKTSLNDYILSLSNQAQVEAKAAEASETETTKLNVLYDALQLQITAGNDYSTQLRDLQDAFPQFFAEIDSATAKTNDLTTAYKNAAEAIKALGIVTAASQLAGGANVEQVKNQVAANSLIPQLVAARADVQRLEDENKNLSASDISAGGGSQIVEAINVAKKNVDAILDQIQKYNTAVAQAKNASQQFYDIAAKSQNVLDAGKNTGLINSLQQQLEALKKIEPYLQTQADITANITQQKQIQAEIDALEGKNAVALLNSKKEELSIQQQIADVVAKAGADLTKSGLTGYALQVADITTKYDALNTTLDKINAKIGQQAALFQATNGKRGISPGQAATDTNSLNSARGLLSDNETQQLSNAQIKDAQTTADAITKINNDFGVKQQSGYNEQLASIKKLYDNIITAAQESALSLTQIDANYQNAKTNANGDQRLLDDAKKNYDAQIQQANDAQSKIAAAKAALLPAIQAVDEKYIQQEQQTYDKIIDIASQAFEVLDDGEESRTDKINLEWQKRIDSASAYFDKLRDLAKASALPQSAIDNINSVQSQVNNVLDAARFKQVSEEISKNFADAMQSAVQGFVDNFYTSLTTLGTTRQTIDEKYAAQLEQQQQAYADGTNGITAAQNASTVAQINNLKQLELAATTSFGAIFSSLVSKFNDTFNKSILDSFTKQFTENLGKTLLTPTAKQLQISPEEKSAQNVATLLKDAGTSLADQIKQAGIDFYNKVNGGAGFSGLSGLLSGASGGSSVSELRGGLNNFSLLGNNGNIGSATDTFGSTVLSSSSLLNDTFKTSAATTTNAATSAATTQTAAADHLSSKIAGAAAALSLAGGLISGATSPTSSVGQGAGGLLQGAGEGALVGSAFGPEGTLIGAGVGAIAGLVSGLFGASKARKELQEQQLAEAQQQTALLKASLAYTSSIIGRDTANGIVTDVSVGATGQLTATVSGKDLQFVLDRNANGR